MTLTLAAVTLLVPDYDEGIDFYVGALGFHLVQDTALSEDKRWVLLEAGGASETRLLLARADSPAQNAAIGKQTGGRVAFFLNTDNFDRDHEKFTQAGVRFREAPRVEAYGKVAVFSDPFGNLWDLIQPA